MSDPVRLTEEELREYRQRANDVAAMGPVPCDESWRCVSLLLDHIAAQDRELAEARELMRKYVPHAYNCVDCQGTHAWLTRYSTGGERWLIG